MHATQTSVDRASAHPPCRYHRRGATRRDVIVGVAVVAIALAIFLLIPSGIGSRGLPKRTLCAANLKAIGTGMYTYANDNGNVWPIAAHAPAVEDGFGRVVYAPGIIGMKRTGLAERRTPPTDTNPAGGGSTDADTGLSVTRSLWLLVRERAVTPGTFICPHDPTAEANDEENPQDFYDFRSYTETSYGIQVPFGSRGQPSSARDARMPLAADKGPFGLALETGKPNPGPPALAVSATPAEWAKWNSPNHHGEGQVVLYADSHAEFQTKPVCGIEKDNIYTRWTGSEGFLIENESARSGGVPPGGRETPWSDTDTLIYP